MEVKRGEFYGYEYWNCGAYPGYNYNDFHVEDSKSLFDIFNLKDKLVLDIGCCFGYHMCELLSRGADVYGVDFSPYVMERIAPQVKDRVKYGDINKSIDFPDNHFDLVYGLHVLEHLEGNAENTLKEIFRVLKPGGYILAVIPTSDLSENGGAAEEHSIVQNSSWWKKQLEKIGMLYEDKADDYRSRSTNVKNWPAGVFVARKPLVKSITYLGDFSGVNAISIVNRNIAFALEEIGITVYRNQHYDKDKKLTDASLRYTWPPQFNIEVKHPIDAIIQAWEFGGAEALPKDWYIGMPKFDRVFGTSKWVSDVYRVNGIPNTRYIQHGVDYTEFNPAKYAMDLDAKGYRFLYVGGTDPRHGLDVALKSFYDEFSPNEDVSLIIKTDTNYPQDIFLEQKYKNHSGITFLHTFIGGMCHLYNACNCLLYPIRGAGGGLPGLEAMACGLPVITSRNSAVQEYAKYILEVGYTIQPARTPYSGMKNPMWAEPSYDDLRKQMRWVFEHKSEAREIGLLASDWVRDNWTWEKSARLLIRGLEDAS